MAVRAENLSEVMNSAALFLAASIEKNGLDVLANPVARGRAVRGAIELWEEVKKQVREHENQY
jgi:hypothetical protein